MNSKSYYVLLSEDGLFFMTAERGLIKLTRSFINCYTWETKAAAKIFNEQELDSHLAVGKIVISVERLV